MLSKILNQKNIKDYFTDDVTDLSYESYEAENDKEADEIEKYFEGTKKPIPEKNASRTS